MSDNHRSPDPPKEVIGPRHESLREEFEPEEVIEERTYGEVRLWLVARDPRTLFVSWDFQRSEHPETRREGGASSLFVRILRGEDVVESTTEIHPKTKTLFIPAENHDCVYSAELGFFTGEIWCFIARSRFVHTPPERTDENDGRGEFATIPANVSHAGMRDLLRGSALPGEAMAETAARIQSRAREKGEWTAEQERQFAQILGEEVEKIPAEASSSMSLAQRIRHRLDAAAKAATILPPIPAPKPGEGPASPSASWGKAT
jgi:hypothetical protein